jgi:cyanophycinase
MCYVGRPVLALIGISLFPLLAITRAETGPGHVLSPAPINPAGIDGALLLVGNGKIPDAARKQFVEQAGGEKARLVIVAAAKGVQGAKDGVKLEADWKALNPESVRIVLADSPKFTEALQDATGVWLGTPPEKGEALAAVLKRKGIVAAAGNAAERMGGMVVEPLDEDHARSTPGFGLLPHSYVIVKSTHGWGNYVQRDTVNLFIDDQTAVLVKGRNVRILGDGNVRMFLPVVDKERPDRWVDFKSGSVADYTTLRRVALGRTQPPFLPKELRTPEVPNGSLVIIGGGGMPADITRKFIDLAGGPDAEFVVLPISMPDPIPPSSDGRFLKRFGVKNITVIKSRDPKELDSPETLAILKKAGGIWFDGGRQWRFVDAYEGTKFEQELHNVLKRGGAIGGSSAGATIQGEYLCRGDPLGPNPIICEGYERGLSFLPGVGIDQHFTQRKRQPDMTKLMAAYPQLLGIGLDEATAIVVKGHVAEVMGRGKAHFYDRRKPVEKDKPDYEAIPAGARYDLKERKVLPKSDAEPAHPLTSLDAIDGRRLDQKLDARKAP